MIAFCCSACQKRLSVKETLAGKKVKCPACGAAVAIPAAVPVTAQDEATAPPSQPGEPEPDQGPTRSGASQSEATRGAEPDAEPNLTDFLAPPQAGDELGRLGKYRILAVLGQGGMGVVFKAEDLQLERTVAIKAMLPTLAASASAGKRFLREARATAAVEHDHIVRIHHVDEDRGVPYLVMEFLKGEPLDERLKRQGKLPLADVLRIGRQVAEGLAAAHEKGLIHRDIKPANVWLEAPRDRVKLLDFGLARASAQGGDLTQQGAIVGTPAYMAPEQARGEPIDARTDLFSLGVVLYRLSCGQPPFKGKDSMSTLLSVCTDQPPAPKQVDPALPAELSELIAQLLEKEPARRPASAATVVEALRILEKKLARQKEAEEGTIQTTAVAKPAAAGPRRRRLPVLIAVLLLLGGLVGVGAWALTRIQTPQGDYVIDTDDPDFAFRVSKGGVTLEDSKTGRKYQLKVHRHDKKGEYELEVADAGKELMVKTKTFTIKRGERVALKAWFERRKDEGGWEKQVAGQSPVILVGAVAARLKERNPGFDGQVTPAVEKGVVVGLALRTHKVKDLSPLRALTGLRRLSCNGYGGQGVLADLSPLKGMNLTYLDCSTTKVSDLSPLAGMKTLVHLNCSQTPVADLSPLKGLPLTYLSCSRTSVSSLAPLKGMPLRSLYCAGTRVAELAPLQGMKLTNLDCGSTAVSDLAVLKGMPLAVLSCSSTRVADLSPLAGVKLTNLACYGTPVSSLAPLEGMPLTSLICHGTKVSDLSPLKGMKLTKLDCSGMKIADLSPLRGMELTSLNLTQTQVADLGPLKGMPLTSLVCYRTRVAELSPLEGMRLTHLDCGGTEVSDLAPLKGMPLTGLSCVGSKVADLSPLKGMQLKTLNCYGTAVTDLSPLKGMPLTKLDCSGMKVSDLGPLRELKSLTSLNLKGTPVVSLSELKGMKLTHLNCSSTKVTDLAPLKGMPLTSLEIGTTLVTDLSPLAGMKLTSLDCYKTKVADLSPLAGMKLRMLDGRGTLVSDLSPLKGMPLIRLYVNGARVTDLSPLKGMPLQDLQCDFKPERDAAVLRSIKTLRTINYKPAKDFWSALNKKKP